MVATHKKYVFPKDDVYYPIGAGRCGRDWPWVKLGDDTGENISELNKNFCELTVLYWAWRNKFPCDYIGLCHYRRYFCSKVLGTRWHIWGRGDYERAMRECDVLLPRCANLDISVRDGYGDVHHAEDLAICEQVIEKCYPEYVESMRKVLGGRRMYPVNMFCMKKSFFNDYMEWLFGVLFAARKRIDLSGHDAYQSRVFGFLSERLFLVWLDYKNLRIKETDMCQLDEEHGWRGKAKWFFQKRKFFYELDENVLYDGLK